MITLQAINRINIGTIASRCMRRVNRQIPAVIYGKKILQRGGLLISMEHEKIFNLQKKNFLYSKRITIGLNKQEFFVIVKEIQYHAFKPIILHIDFLCS